MVKAVDTVADKPSDKIRVCHRSAQTWNHASTASLHSFTGRPFTSLPCSDRIFGAADLSTGVHQAILPGQPFWDMLCKVVDGRRSSSERLLPFILTTQPYVCHSVGLRLCSSLAARTPASTPPVQAASCSKRHRARRPAATPIQPASATLGSVCGAAW